MRAIRRQPRAIRRRPWAIRRRPFCLSKHAHVRPHCYATHTSFCALPKNLVWCEFYIMAVVIFMTHACLGWGTLTLAPSFGIPKELQCCVKFYGYLIFWVIGLTYIPFLVFVTLTQRANIECLIWKVQRLDLDRRKV